MMALDLDIIDHLPRRIFESCACGGLLYIASGVLYRIQGKR